MDEKKLSKEERLKNLMIFIEEKEKEDKVVFIGIDNYMCEDIEDIISQPTDGLLYDLNRLPEVVWTFLKEPEYGLKWVNDYAVYLVIKRLKKYYDQRPTVRLKNLLRKIKYKLGIR